MREIKFRAMSKRTNEMVYGIPFFNSLGGWSTRPSIELETLGQYTGLKDKNGTDIYEGDIMQGWRAGSNSDRSYTGVIEWRYDQAGWIIKCGKFILEILSLAMEGDCLSTRLSSFEVIGNIHQNPELIK